MWNEQGNQSELKLQLIPLEDVKATHTIVAKTVIGHLIVRHDNNEETHVNPTSVESARYQAMMKGTKRMLRQCRKDDDRIEH